MKKLSNRFISVFLAGIIISSVCFLGWNTSQFTVSALYENDANFIALKKENLYLGLDKSNCDYLNVSEIDGGGIHYSFSGGNNAINKREGYKETVNLNGLKLYFGDLKSNEKSSLYDSVAPGKNSRMLLLIGDNYDGSGPRCWGESGKALGIEIRPEDGNLYLCSSTGNDIVRTALFSNSQECLKYENLIDKEFSYEFRRTSDNGYVLIVTVQGFKSVKSKEITNEEISAYRDLKNPEEVHIMVSTISTNQMTDFGVDFYGLSQNQVSSVWEYCDTIDELYDMSDDVLLYSGNVMRSARKSYDALNDDMKSQITNYDKLTDVEKRYSDLSKAADSNLITMDKSHTRYTNAAELMPDSYSNTINGSSYKGLLTVTNLPNGGLNLNFPKSADCNVGVKEAYSGNVNLDGLKLQFDNFIDNGGGTNYMAGQMAIIFGNGEFYQPTFDSGFALVLNPYTGTLYATPNEKGNGTSIDNIDGYKIIQSEYLKGSNLEYRRFSIELSEMPEIIYDASGNPHHNFKVTIKISGVTLTGILPYDGVLNKISSNGIYATNNVTVAISLATPYGNQTTRGYSVDWLGIDTGIVAGKNGNFDLNESDIALSGGAIINQGQISLPQNASVEFEVKTDKIDLRCLSYSNSSNVTVRINGQDKQVSLTGSKFYDKWFTIAENITTDVYTTVKITNTNSSLVILNGIYINKSGDVDGDGAVTNGDLNSLRKYICEISNSGVVEKYSDLNADGITDIRDLVVLDQLINKTEDYIDNSDLLPTVYQATSNQIDENKIPFWVSDLIIGEVNLRTATKSGTIQEAVSVLDHYAEMGINGIWITPIFDGGSSGNGYGNLGINTIDPKLTGETDYQKGWAILKNFIDEAHKRNIRIILDIVFRGVESDSQLYKDHTSWFEKDTQYNNFRFKWDDKNVNIEIAEFYISEIVSIAEKTGCDGFRYDMMPATVSNSGTNVEKLIIDALQKNGKYLFIMSESANDRTSLYATETVSITEALSYDYYNEPYDLFLGKYNISDFITDGNDALNGKGEYKYYTYSLANHDFKKSLIKGRRISVGYQAIFSPFIPIIYLGEEWNNGHNSTVNYDNALYYNKIDWSSLNNIKNREFYEDIKLMIRIRRKYSELFGINFEIFKDSNICSLKTTNSDVSAYARYANGCAALVIPNNKAETTSINISVSLEDLHISNYNSFKVIDAETEKLILQGNAETIKSITIPVDAKDQRVLIIIGE